MRAHLLQWLGLSLPFVLAQPSAAVVHQPLLRSLLLNAVLFVVPGIPFVGLVAAITPRRAIRLRWLIPCSLLTLIIVLVGLRLTSVEVTGLRLWNTTWAVTSLACLGAAALRTPVLRWNDHIMPHRAALCCFLVAYVALFFSATRVVPVLGDHDDELQGTTYGLMTQLAPSLKTGRGTDYVFAHPPLAHLTVAAALTYYDHLEWLSALDSRAAHPLDSGAAWRRFLSRPLLMETRTPSLFVSAATIALLVGLIQRRTGLAWLGSVAAAVYLSVPEVLVRSSYAGYFATGSLFAMATIFATEEWTRDGGRMNWWSCIVAAGLTALTDHKLVLLPAAVGLWSLWTARGSWSVRVEQAVRHPVIIGFAAGTMVFWLYGLVISPQDFWLDHVRHHILDRVTHHNARDLDLSVYPDVIRMWLEFLRDTGYAVVPVGLVLGWLWIRRNGTGSPDTFLVGVLVAWTVLTALSFSLVDWRQTKHLVPMVLPMVCVLAIFGQRYALRLVAPAALVVVLVNGPTLRSLVTDFASVTKAPEW